MVDCGLSRGSPSQQSAIENPNVFNQQSAIENQQSGVAIARKIMRTHTRDAPRHTRGLLSTEISAGARRELPQRGVREPTKTSESTSPRDIRVGEGVDQGTK
jgi:hypothetical protein